MPIFINSPLAQPYVFKDTAEYVGDKEYIPYDIRWRRTTVISLMRRLGTPVLVKHRYTDIDVRDGIAIKAPDRDSSFGQARYNSITLSTGYASVELSPSEWINMQTGQIVVAPFSPGTGYIQAPKYRGFGPSHETYIIELDRERDYFAYQPGGAIQNVEQGGVIAPWYPKINDGDLIIEVIRDKGNNVISANQIWEAKKVTPVTMRGHDRKGNIERPTTSDLYENTTNRFLINQRFENELIPFGDPRNNIQIDR